MRDEGCEKAGKSRQKQAKAGIGREMQIRADAKKQVKAGKSR